MNAFLNGLFTREVREHTVSSPRMEIGPISQALPS